MRIINIVDRFDTVNLGIWNAASFTAEQLALEHGWATELWFPAQTQSVEQLPHCQLVPLDDTRTEAIDRYVASRQLHPERDVVVSHGVWRFPTRWGFGLHRRGFRWVYTPHGMLEPWGLRQKWLKKIFYLYLAEIPMARRANLVRAVGSPERANLQRWFARTVLVPNGVELVHSTPTLPKQANRLLFLARLHHKKGVVPLVEAWQQSVLFGRPDYELLIAGPDDGELPALQRVLAAKPGNCRYLGAVYGQAKADLLASARFFVLPSASEGFPTGVLEALQHGLIPLISRGCNFPELAQQGIGLALEHDIGQMRSTFDSLPQRSTAWLAQQEAAARAYVAKHYSAPVIADQQNQMYRSLLR